MIRSDSYKRVPNFHRQVGAFGAIEQRAKSVDTHGYETNTRVFFWGVFFFISFFPLVLANEGRQTFKTRL